ncbi:MAG: hypothetical protein CTY29_10390 [Methylobacter sp.]|nr:MAG: hypothetical protein CTY29_10390 [Methylobacter sp.]
MEDIEDKFKKFMIDEKMMEMFCHSSIDLFDKYKNSVSFSITTVIFDQSGNITESQDAKLV